MRLGSTTLREQVGRLPVCDVYAATVRPNRVSRVVSQHPVVPFDESFLTVPSQDWVLNDRQITGEQAVELCSEPVSCAWRQTRLNPATSK